MRRRLLLIMPLVMFSAAAEAEDGKGFSFKLDPINIPEIIHVVSEMADKYLRDNPQKDRMERIRDLLAQLGGEEAQAAGQLALALRQAETNGTEIQTANALNAYLGASRRTFDDLKGALGAKGSMRAINAQAAAGLYCVAADSVLFGYEGGCPNVAVGDGTISTAYKSSFAAGRVEKENVKARRMIVQIQRESSYLLEIANAFDAAIAEKATR
jgi:hypothetical protein